MTWYFRGRPWEKNRTKNQESRAAQNSAKLSRTNASIEHCSRTFASIRCGDKKNKKRDHWWRNARDGAKIIFIFRCIFPIFKWSNFLWKWTTLYHRYYPEMALTHSNWMSIFNLLRSYGGETQQTDGAFPRTTSKNHFIQKKKLSKTTVKCIYA